MSHWYFLDEHNQVQGPVPIDKLTDYFGWGRNDRVAPERPHGVRPCGWERVGLAGIGSDCTISTVFLGLDHRFGTDGLPIVFETLVQGGPLDQEMDRYCTWDLAMAGHERVVARCREQIQADDDDQAAIAAVREWRHGR